MRVCKLFHSVQSLDQQSHQRDMTVTSAEILFQSCQQGATVSILAWAGMSTPWCCPSSIYLLTMASPILKGALRVGSGEAVMMCDMPESREFLSFNSCQKRCLWTNKATDLALHPVVGSCAASKRCREVSSSAWFWMPGSSVRSQPAGSMFHSQRGGWRWQETCKTWIRLWNWWHCSNRSCLIWLLLPLLRQSQYGFLFSSAILAQGCSQVLEIGHLLMMQHNNTKFGDITFGGLEDIIWTNIDILTLRCDLDLECSNPLFFCFVYKTLLLMMMYQQTKFGLLKNQQFIRYSRNNHILFIWANAVTLTLKIKNFFFFSMTLWFMMLHYHFKFGNKMTCCSEDILWTNIYRHLEPLLRPWL